MSPPERLSSEPAARSRLAAARSAAALVIALLVGISALLLGGCALSGQGGGAATASSATAAALAPTPPRRLHARGLKPAAASAQLRRLQARLSVTMRREGRQTGAIVQDLSDGSLIYSLRSTVSRSPASLEKLYTSVAALDLLGAGARLQTAVLGVGHLGRGGVWYGDLYLRGGGDPTFGDGAWNKLYMGGYGPTATELVAQLRKHGIRRVTGWVYGDESLFDSDRGGPATHNRPDIPDYGGELSALVYDHGMSAPGKPPPVFAAHELVLTMGVQGIRARSARHARVTPTDAAVLAQVSSPPLSVLLRLMNVPSDDLIADLLTKQLGARFLGQGSLSAGASEIEQALAEHYQLKPVIHDGSGLDRRDSTSPAQLVSLLDQVWGTPTGAVLRASLPIVGRQGTVQGIGAGTYAAGHCVAKTGTLNDVTNLAGYCTTRSRQTLAFALMIDGPPNGQAVSALSRAVGAIAAY